VYSIEPRKTALLIIDPQREYFDAGRPLFTPNAESIRNNLLRIRAAADSAGVMTVLVQHVHKADGSDVGRMGDFDPTLVFVEGTPWVEPIPDLAPRSQDVVITKTRYSAFVKTNLEETLASLGIDTVIVTGLMTNYCSVTTARHAHDLDYKVVFVRDANAGPDMPDLGMGPVSHEEIMKVISTTLAGGVAEVVTTEELLSRLEGR
jgi:nicotinamidase-related amidase